MKMKTLLLALITSFSLISLTYADSKIEESQLEKYELIEIEELPPIVDLVIINSAAEIVGIKSKDKFLRVNGVPINTWREFTGWIKKSPKQSVQIQVERNKKIIELVLTPEDVNGIGRAGVSLFIPKSYYEQFIRPAKLGNAEAQYRLGKAYYDVVDLGLDFKKAFKWFKKAAEQGHHSAQYELGSMYHSGIGVIKDPKQAFNWKEKAAKQGNPEAQGALGISYMFGLGVTKDYAQGLKWLLRADKQGDGRAAWALGYRYLYNYLGVTQDYNQAFNWFKKGADRGNHSAQYELGKLYYSGNGVEKNYKKAFSLFQLSEFFNNQSKGQLAVMYAEGKGVSKDLSKAKALLQEIFDYGSKNEKNRAKKTWERYNLWEF